MNTKEAAAKAGIAEKTFRMHVLRGKVRSTKVEGKVEIDEADLDAYIIGEGLKDAVFASRGSPAQQIYDRLNAALVNLPQDLKDAILQGMPKTGRGGTSNGDPTAWPKAVRKHRATVGNGR